MFAALRAVDIRWRSNMKVLLVSSPAMGHLNPVLGVGRILISDGHDVMGMTSNYLRSRVENIGAKFRGFLPAADVDYRNLGEMFPEFKVIPPGPEWLRLGLEQAFVGQMLPQYESIKAALQQFPADLIIGDHLMTGVLPLLLEPRTPRPEVDLLGTTYLIIRRDDGAPNDAGIPPAISNTQRDEYKAIFQAYQKSVFGPVRDCLNGYLAQIAI